jgi:hypothetical protein
MYNVPIAIMKSELVFLFI